MFVVANDGYVLLTKVEVDCGFSVSDSNGNSFSNSIAGFENAADHLWHSDKFTLPCFNISLGVCVVRTAFQTTLVYFRFLDPKIVWRI